MASRMFLINGKPMKTWNIFIGCDYGCTFCNARKAALTRLRHIPRYKDGFRPKLVPEELTKTWQPGDFVFVGYMGDISFATRPVAGLILSKVRQYPETLFLFCSKNPGCYIEWDFDYPENLYLGATIETDRDYGLSKAPPPEARFQAMVRLSHPKKFISIEPIMEFHVTTLAKWLYQIKPEIIEVGPDNYHNNLKEPPGWKVRDLLRLLTAFCPTVVEKPGLERLKEAKSERRG